MMATQLLMGDEQRRRNLGLQLGAGIGGAMAGGLATGLAGADQGPETPGQEAGAPGGDVQGALAQMVAPQPPELQNPVTGYQVQPDFSPSLTPGSIDSPEGFGTLTYDQSLEDVGGMNMSPLGMLGQPEADTQLQEPAPGADMNQTGLRLPSLADPSTMEQAKKRYRELTTRPEEAPLPDRSGMDMSYIQQEEMRHWERNLDLMVQSGELGEEEASQMLRNKKMELAMQGGI
jgi:hypothetical protein